MLNKKWWSSTLGGPLMSKIIFCPNIVQTMFSKTARKKGKNCI